MAAAIDLKAQNGVKYSGPVAQSDFKRSILQQMHVLRVLKSRLNSWPTVQWHGQSSHSLLFNDDFISNKVLNAISGFAPHLQRYWPRTNKFSLSPKNIVANYTHFANLNIFQKRLETRPPNMSFFCSTASPKNSHQFETHTIDARRGNCRYDCRFVESANAHSAGAVSVELCFRSCTEFCLNPLRK